MNTQQSTALLEPRELAALLDFAKTRRSVHRARDIRREGPLPQRRRGRGLDIEESRPYQAGDDPRHMDWRATARSGRPMTKTFHDEKAKHVWIWLDRGPYMNFGSGTESKATAAARLAVLAAFSATLRQGEVNAVTAEQQPRVFTRLAGLDAVLRFVTRAIAPLPATQPEFDPLQALETLNQKAPRQAAIVLVSDFLWLNESLAARVGELSRQRSVVAVHIFDQAENCLPERGRWRFQDPAGGAQIAVNVTDKKLRAAFDEAVSGHNTLVQRVWERCGATYLHLATDHNHLETLAHFL